MNAVSSLLKRWFHAVKRDFPWREKTTPYGVWVSEVMLQQTQASVVVAYYERFMKRFPTLSSLAKASVEEVVKYWEGLGYYSRARNLHRGAQFVVQNHGGVLPQEEEALLEIPGLGPYTVGAVRAFAFHLKAAAVDGNVERVVSRLFAIQEVVDKSSVKKEIRRLSESLLPAHEPWVVTEALIELGAMVCKKIPQCGNCPLQSHCEGYRQGVQDELPRKGKRPETIALDRYVFLMQHKEQFLVRRVPDGLLMAGLYEFPYFEELLEEPPFSLNATLMRKMALVSHSFTRYKAALHPSHFIVHRKKEVPGFVWVSLEEAAELPFSAGHRKILRELAS